MKANRFLIFALGLAIAALAFVPTAKLAAPQACAPDVITESDVTRQVENSPPTDNWVLYTRAGTPPTAGAFVTGPAMPPLGAGSLQLTTVTGAEKVFLFNYDHFGKSISDVDAIAYSTYRTAGNLQQVTALNMQIDYNGADPGGFATLVFEPVYNTDQGAVVSGQWQTWNAFATGVWWSTQPINGQCAGATAACDKTWAEIVANNPDATILAFGVNQGSGNDGLIASVDKLTIGFDTDACDFVYDFEPDADSDGVSDATDNCVNVANPLQENSDDDNLGDACDPDDDNDGIPDTCDVDSTPEQDTDVDNDGIIDSATCDTQIGPPSTTDQCKNGGWKNYNAPRTFKNQGDCIQYVNTGK